MLADLFYEEGDEQNGSSSANESSNGSYIPKPPEPRGNSGFVGLENQGATCYLNSLIQAMYMTPELRRGLFAIDPTDLGLQISTENDVTEPVDSAASKPEPDEGIIEHLRTFGFSYEGAYRSVEATTDVEAALDYALAHSEDENFNDPLPNQLAAAQESGPGKRKKKKPRLIPLELQRLFTKMQCLDCTSISTEDLTTKGFQWQGMDGRVQHDAHELNRLLIDAIEKSLKHSTPSAEKLCQQLYQGTLAYQTRCLNCNTITEREENYYDLLLQVLGCRDTATSLRAYTAPELLDGSNKYACDVCASKQNAHRRVAIKSAPPLLTISCQRFDIDRSTWQRVKVTSKCEFPLAMSMSPFMEGSDGVDDPISADATEEAERCRDLRSGMVWLDQAHEAARKEALRLRQIYGPDITLDHIMADTIQYEQIGNALAPRHPADPLHYRLFAVIMHHGTAYSGHYSAFIRDSRREGNWTAPSVDTGSQSGKTGHTSDAMSRICFVQSSPGQLLVKEGSPLSVLLSIMNAATESDSISRRSTSASAGRSMQISQLSGLVKRNIGKNWNQLYQKNYGSLMDFAKGHTNFFGVDGTAITLRDARYQVAPEEQFAVELRRVYVNGGRALESDDTRGPSPSTSDLMGDADAVLAAQLHEEECSRLAADSASTKEESRDENGGWQSSGTKKKNKSRKQRNKLNAKAAAAAAASGTTPTAVTTPTGSPDSKFKYISSRSALEGAAAPPSAVPVAVKEGEISGISGASAAEDGNSAEDAQVELLAQQLLNVYHGPFFCFNDSEVRPVYLTDLTNAFEGRSSAYLLIYRQTGEDGTWNGSCEDAMDVSSVLNGPAEVPMQPPALWLDQVLSRNVELQRKRLEYENYMHSVKLTIYFPAHFTSSWPCVTLVSAEDLVDMGALPHSVAAGLEIECDISKGVKMLREDIISKALTALASADLSTVLGLPDKGRMGDDDIKISKLQAVSGTDQYQKQKPLYYVCPALAASDVVGDALAHNSSVVLWTSSHLPDRSGNIELMAEAPKSLTVTFKAEPCGSMVSKELYLPLSFALQDLCRVAAETLGLDLTQVQIHAMQERRIIYQTKTQGGRVNEWFATPVWKSKALAKSFALQNQRYRQMEWSEVFVENVGSARPSASGLASKEVLRRNRLRSIRVELDVGSSTVTRLRKDYAKGGSMFPDDASTQTSGVVAMDGEDVTVDGDDLISTTAKLEIDQNATILELKLLALDRLGFGSWVADLSRLRSGMHKGDGLLTKESLSITEAGLLEGAALSLELASLPNDDKITLRFCKVVGNDISVKFNPQQPGERSEEASIQVMGTDLLSSMRERMLASVEEHTPSQSPHTRLRLTNWAGESGELLEELDSETGDPLTVGSAIDSGKLKPGDLLVVEEGRVPIKGHLNVKLSLWRSDITIPTSTEIVSAVTSDEVKASFSDLRASCTPPCLEHPDRAAKARLLTYIGEVACHEDGLLVDFYESAFYAVKNFFESELSINVPLVCPKSADFLMLREFREDYLPGECSYIAPPRMKSSGSSLDLSSIGKKSNKKRTATPRDPRQLTLKKAGFRGDDMGELRLVVQIREEGQSSTGAPLPGEFSVWAAGVSVRNVTESSSDAVTTEEVTFLSWPPNEVSMVGAGATPTLGHFQRLLSAEFGIPFDDLAVFKFVPRLALWVPLKPGMKSSTKKGKKSGGNSGKVENIILAPYTFRDGDLVAVVDLRTCGKSGSASVDGDPSDYSDLFVDRIEDAYDRWLIEEYEKTRLVYKSGNKSGKKRPIVEITLRFGGDLDFSDDDEDSN